MAFVNKTRKLLHLKAITINSRLNASFMSEMVAKTRKFLTGSPRPLPTIKPRQPDTILEEIERIQPNYVPYERRMLLKHQYMQHKSRQILIAHNKKIRNLDKKIKAGRYDNYDYANRW